MKIKIFLLSLIAFTSKMANAQTISGKLVDSKTHSAISFANLALTSQTNQNLIKYTLSDSTGQFEFKNILKGKYTLSVALIGYKKTNHQLTIDDQTLQKIDLGLLTMEEDLNILNEVSITGGTPNYSTQNGQVKIGIANNLFFKSSVNLLDVLRKLPGIQVNQDGTVLMGNRATPTLFVDGKPVNMSSAEIQAYLNSLTPDMVESIELINQPSAKYDGEYQGIIDVRLKRNQSLGLKGIYNNRFQQNNYSMLDNNLSLAYKTNRFIYNLDLGSTLGNSFYQYHSLQYLANANAITTDTRTITYNQNFNAQARITYEIKKGQSLELFSRTSQIDRNAKTANRLLTQTPNLANILSITGSDNNAVPKQHNYAGGINYDALFKNSELHMIASLVQIDNRQTEDIQNRNSLSKELLSYWKTNSRNNVLIRSAQADYVQDLPIGKLELGTKFAYNTTGNNLRYDTLGKEAFNLDPKRSNQFKYQEQIKASYLSYGAKWSKFNYRLSLRVEHTQTTTNSTPNSTITERTYLKWLPSLNLTYAINSNEQLSFNYSKRLTRPTFSALNPFRFYYSPRHYWIGNPYLQPSTTSLFALSYSRKALNISLNAGRELNPMARYPEYNPATDELIFLGRNLPYRDFSHVQVSSPITVNKWWRMSNNIGFYYNKELTPYFGKTYQIPIYNYTINGSQVFSLKDLLFDLSYNYESKSGNGLYIMAPVYSIDFGLQKTWLRNRINTKLTFYDIFDNARRRLIFRDKTIFNNDFYHYFASQRLTFSLTYNFGSSTYKSKESKKSEEENRAN